MLISGNSTGIEEVSTPCIAALLVRFTGGTKSLDNLFRGNNAEWRGRFIRMRSRGSVGQIEENVTSSDKFRGGEIDTWTARRRGEWSKEGVESRERSEGAKLVYRSTDKTGKIREERGNKDIDKERCPVKGSVPDTLWTNWYKENRMTILRRGNVTSDDVRVERMASVDVVGRPDDKGEKEILIQRRVLDRGEIFRQFIM